MQTNTTQPNNTDRLERYTRQAELSGARTAWALAQGDGLSAPILGRLAARLRSLDPPARVDSRGYRIETEARFKLKSREKRALAAALIDAGVADGQIVLWSGISRSTLWRVHQDRQNGGLTPLSDPASDAGLRVSNRPNVEYRSSLPMFHFDATSGGTDVDAIRRLLR